MLYEDVYVEMKHSVFIWVPTLKKLSVVFSRVDEISNHHFNSFLQIQIKWTISSNKGILLMI